MKKTFSNLEIKSSEILRGSLPTYAFLISSIFGFALALRISFTGFIARELEYA